MICPLCNEEVKSTYGLSRFDNSTNICSECSTKEAYFLWFNSASKEKLISGDMIKEGAVVVDVGINRNSNNTIVGDVDFETAQKKASKITLLSGNKYI